MHMLGEPCAALCNHLAPDRGHHYWKCPVAQAVVQDLSMFWHVLGVSHLGLIMFGWLAALAHIYIGICGLLSSLESEHRKVGAATFTPPSAGLFAVSLSMPRQ